VPVYSRELTFIGTDADAELQVRQRDASDKLVWRPVCARTCTTPAFFGAEYRVSGPGVTGSRVFKIEPSPYPMYVHADAGSSAWRTTSIIMLPVGGTAMILGMVVFATAGCSHCEEGPAYDQHRREVLQVGLPLLLGGAAIVAGGIVLMISNRTKLEIVSPRYASVPRFDLGGGFAIGPQGLTF
jgi:hypothetical protein